MFPDAQISDHIARSGRFFLVLAASVFLIGFVGAWTAGIGFLLFLLGAPLIAGALVIGGLIFSVRGIRLARELSSASSRPLFALAAPLMIVAAVVLAWPTLATGALFGSWTRLMINRGHYETIIANVRKGHRSPSATSAFEEDRGVEYYVDPGPPVRVAFNPEGFLDNWSGIIFDPSGIVMRADGFDPKTGEFAAPDEVTKLFGGDLVSCRSLGGDYYYCNFT
jgi:hypothetical protein